MLSQPRARPVRTCVRSASASFHRHSPALGALMMLAAAACGGAVGAPSAAGSGQGDATVTGDAALAWPTATATTSNRDAAVDDSAPLTAAEATSAVRKVKGLLTGQAISDSEVERVMSEGQAGLKKLIRGYMEDAATSAAFRDK